MEIDLLCADSRVVVEIDGGQHLADPVAYRRDRRKDQLLQENGYLVLRYLAEDLAKELDSVLDGILRSLSSRRARWSRRIPSTSCAEVVREEQPMESRSSDSALITVPWRLRSSDADLLFGRDHEASSPLFHPLRLEHRQYALEQRVTTGSRKAHKKETGVSAGV